MRRLLALWEKETLVLSRDVLGLAVLFLMPAAFIVIMSLALSDVFRDGSGRPGELAVLAAAATAAVYLTDGIAGKGFKATRAPANEAAAREQVRKGSPALVLVVPERFGAD